MPQHNAPNTPGHKHTPQYIPRDFWCPRCLDYRFIALWEQRTDWERGSIYVATCPEKGCGALLCDNMMLTGF